MLSISRTRHFTRNFSRSRVVVAPASERLVAAVFGEIKPIYSRRTPDDVYEGEPGGGGGGGRVRFMRFARRFLSFHPRNCTLSDLVGLDRP